MPKHDEHKGRVNAAKEQELRSKSRGGQKIQDFDHC